jgi:adenosylcobyric acid synthase
VVPYFAEAGRLPAEDALAVQGRRAPGGDRAIRVAVPVLSRIANFDDLDPLVAEPDVAVDFVEPGRALPGDADLVVLPGSKATRADLAVLSREGWDIDILAHVRRGGWLLGLCGGYQMLGREVADPDGIEGPPGCDAGLGLLDIDTEIAGDKALTAARGSDLATGQAVSGYEMHVGRTRGAGLTRPMLRLDGRDDGAVSADGRVMGCYLHGLFAADGFRHAFLSRLKARADSGVAYEAEVERVLDGLADHLAAHVDLDRLLEVAHGG